MAWGGDAPEGGRRRAVGETAGPGPARQGNLFPMIFRDFPVFSGIFRDSSVYFVIFWYSSPWGTDRHLKALLGRAVRFSVYEHH